MLNLFKKRFVSIIIFGIIELLAYLYFKPDSEHMESFFMLWIVVSAVLLLTNIFYTGKPGSGPLPRIGRSNPAALVEKIYETPKSKSRSLGGLKDPINLTYLLYFIINIIGYIIVTR